jgi:ElaB/YqjD/DUF883 family membrane-anchored ribosome-binding protein
MTKDRKPLGRPRVTPRTKATSGAARKRIAAVREDASDVYAKSRKVAGETYVDAKDKAYKAADMANRFIIEHPMVATAAAVAAGALFSILFPRGRAAIRNAPALASALGSKAIEAAKAARDSVDTSELADSLRHRAEDLTSATLDIATAARSALADADIPNRVRARATEAAEAAREAIERARLPERASRLAETATSQAGEAFAAVSKAVNDRLPHK